MYLGHRSIALVQSEERFNELEHVCLAATWDPKWEQ